MSNCTCDLNKLLGNGGTPGCVVTHDVGTKTLRMPKYTNAGVRNFIDLDQVGDSAYWSAFFQNDDPSARLFPTPRFKTYTKTNADDITESFDDQTSILLQEGIINVEAIITAKASPAMVRELRNDRCTDYVEYVIDLRGGLIGGGVDGNKLYGIDVDNESLSIKFIDKTLTTAAKVQMNYNYSTLHKSGDLYYVESGDIGVDLLAQEGLLPLEFVVTVPTATGATVKVSAIYGSELNKYAVPGLLPAQFIANNDSDVTQPSPIVVTTTTEGPAGTYVLVYNVPDQPSVTDVITLYIDKDTLSPDDRVEYTTA